MSLCQFYNFRTQEDFIRGVFLNPDWVGLGLVLGQSVVTDIGLCSAPLCEEGSEECIFWCNKYTETQMTFIA